jgi:predicted ATP-dependent endonuclease of OLD family
MATEVQTSTAGLDRSLAGIGAPSTMIQSVEIRNFRCFREAKIEGLRRINVIVGGNGSGKTAFLEALFMCAGMGADFFLRVQAWRGLAEPAPTGMRMDERAFRDIWREMFFGFDESEEISIRFSVGAHNERHLRAYYDPNPSARRVILTPAGDKAPSMVVPLMFKGQSESGTLFEGPVAMTTEGAIPLPQFVEPYPFSFMPPVALINSQHSARRYSELSRKEQHQPVIDAVRALFPMVLDLSVEIQGGSNAIFASVRGLGEKLYVGSLSAGINKYLGILLALAAPSGGAVAIDEVENGLYYKNLEEIWKSITGFARRMSTQLFATTHSLECLRAMLPAISAAPEDFCLLRAERQDGESLMRAFDGEHFEAALEQNFEIR